ncbi:MAG: DUF4080 domain-containing protein [Spirochaetota bacterium]
MNKLILIGINARYSHPATALYYLKRYVRDLEWDVSIKEFTINTPAPEILQSISDEKPRAVAFSVYIWNTTLVQQVLSALGQMNTRPVIVLGGPDASYNPDEWLARYSFIDYIIAGHGEEAFRNLFADDLIRKERIIRMQNPPFQEIPFPYTDADLAGFTHRKIYYESSRGCLFKCAYCLSSREDQRLEFRDIGLVKEELEIIMKHKPRIIKFVDRTFNSKQSHAHAVWEHIICSYAHSGTRFHFEIHPDLLNDKDFEILKKCPAGLFQFEIGIQSTNEQALKAVNRKGDWETIKPKIKRLIDMNTIPVHTDLIAGLPFEDYESLAFSFNEVYPLGADHFQPGYLKVLPGTEVRERANEWGLCYASEPPYEVTSNSWLNADNMKTVKSISKLVDILYNSHRFKITLENLLTFYKSAFSFFEELSGTAAQKSAKDGMQWEYLAGILIECALALRIDREYILDCLRWDWCASSASNRMPKMLKTDTERKKRKEFFALIKEKKQALLPEKISEVPAAELYFFYAETADFRNKYLSGKSCAVFICGKKEALISNF